MLSAAAFNFFHLPPVGQFTIKDSSNWVALVTFLVVAALASSVAEVTRARAREAEERRHEADLAAEMARLLLRGRQPRGGAADGGGAAGADAGAHSAAIEMEAVEADERSVAFPLREGTAGWARCWSEPTPPRRACAGCRSAWCPRWRRC